MLASLTTTAVARGWPVNVYSRLVSQLGDFTDLGGQDAVLETFEELILESSPSPMLLEYICVLSNEAHSPIFFPCILKRLASTEKISSQPVKDMVAYLGRYAFDNWVLPLDYDNYSEISDSISKLIGLANSNKPEFRLLAAGLASKVLPQVLSNTSDNKLQIENGLALLGITVKVETSLPSQGSGSKKYSLEKDHNPVEEERHENDAKLPGGRSSRSLRLLWLDWILRTAQSFEFENFRRQLDIVWPGDRESVISYELCITAFDILASAKPDFVPKLARPFLTRALPFLLQKLNSDNLIDSVIARIFTTLDKSIVEVVEKRFPGIRAEFGAACVDVGLCDPTIMHALHRSHTKKEAHDGFKNSALQQLVSNPSQFLDDHPENQRQLAQNLHKALFESGTPISRHEAALLCEQLFKNPEMADLLFVFLPVRNFLIAICAFADLTAAIPEEEGGAGLVFVDLGHLLSLVQWIKNRYQNISLPDGWTNNYLSRVKFASASELSPELNQIMGHWIVGLFSGSGSGIADELLRPFKELGEILPALLQQAVRAYRSAVIDRETLKSGLDYFVTHYSVTLLAPLVVTVLRTSLFEGTHQSTTLECLIFFLTMLLQRTTSDYDIGKCLVLWVCREISADLEEIESCNTQATSKSSSVKKLQDAFHLLVEELAQRLPSQMFVPPTCSLRVGETTSLFEDTKSGATALANWQTKLQGIPSIPISFPQAKSALGVESICDLIEESTMTESKEVLIAILVFDALWCPNNRLLNERDSPPFQIAKGIYNEFELLFDKAEVPEVRISADEEIPNNVEAPETVQEQAPLSELLTPSMLEDNSFPGPSNKSPVGATAAQGMSSFDGMEGITESFGQNFPQELNTENNEFEGDFVSQPMMNLADLDSAMDFAWE